MGQVATAGWQAAGRWIRSGLSGLAGLVVPRICPLCRSAAPVAGGHVCAACGEALEALPEPRCAACGGALDGILAECGECLRLGGRPWNRGVSVFAFGGPVRQAIHRLKYHGHAYLAPWLGACMARSWIRHGSGLPDAVTPVPLHWTRRYTRGYNQAELLARAVAAGLNVPMRRILRRRRRTAQQAVLDARERQRNLRDGFVTRDKTKIDNRRILLVDDVLTTGSTLAAASRVLIEAGTATVGVVTAARG